MEDSDKDQDLSEYAQTSPEETEAPKIQLAVQPDFYRVPHRFGSVPVDELPLGCDRDKQYYDKYPAVKLPFQRVERVSFGHPELDANRLIWGDNLHVMRMLPSNSIDLIYLDPPFFSGRNYNVIFGDRNEVRSFTDIWEGGMLGYLVWLNARLLEMKRLLKPTGSIYVHCDWHACHYIKTEMDKIFGYDNFKNQIIWKRTSAHTGEGTIRSLGTVHDIILCYSKGEGYTFNAQYLEYDKEYEEKFYRNEDSDGRRWTSSDLMAAGIRHGESGKPWHGIDPAKKGNHWKFKISRLDELERLGRIYFPQKAGGVPRYKRYLDEMKGVLLQDIWDDILPLQAHSKERIGYPTQKPEALLERIIKISSNPGDVVADFFCGGGTSAVVAQKQQRRWIATDSSRIATSITMDRVIKASSGQGSGIGVQQSLANTPDFSIEYWGIYEVPALVKLSDEEFRRFILSAYNARVASGEAEIHGYKNGIPVHVGWASQDKRIEKADVINFARFISTKKGKHNGTMLAWAFAPSAQAAAEKLASQGLTTIDFVKISLVQIESDAFKEGVVAKHKEYGSFLTFVLPPEVRLHVSRTGQLAYDFDLSESVSLNASGRIANVQWDFDYKDRFVSTEGYSFIRVDDNRPALKLSYKFPKSGPRNVACKVQDDLGGEKLLVKRLEVD